MQLKLLLLVLFVCMVKSHSELNETTLLEKWTKFKQTYKSSFLHPKEENVRKTLFQKRVQIIEEHNERYKKGLETYEMAVNRFTDFTEKEMLPYTHGLKPHLQSSKLRFLPSTNLSHVAKTELPSSVDWREKEVVTMVKDQGMCGSCWAFSVTGAIEAHYKIRYGATVTLSEQQLMDCVYQCYGCMGGWMDRAYEYIISNGGISYDSYYPYEAFDNYCRYNMIYPKVEIDSFLYLWPDEEELKYHVATYGPVTVAIDANDGFAYYSGGVYYNRYCSTYFLNHAVLVVGYDTENGQDYWLVKNSWGADWGIDGYIKMARNRNNNCGIASEAMIPIL